MAACLLPALLEACVVVGASVDKLQEIYQDIVSDETSEPRLLDPEVLHVVAAPFVTRTQPETLKRRVKRRRPFLRKKQDRLSSAAEASSQGGGVQEERDGDENSSTLKDMDLVALPQFCFPGGGLQVTSEQKREQFHFLVFTDIFGNKTYGVVLQYDRPVLDGASSHQNGTGTSKIPNLFSPYCVCILSKHPYFSALKDCLSCLLIELRSCRLSDVKEKVKDFAAKLSLVPIPPPGHLHLMFSLSPLTITLPSRLDNNQPVIDLDLHLPFLCFRPQTLLQVLSCLLQEQQLVFFSSDFSKLTLISESLLIFLKPLCWQHPYVPVLARGMLDFVMAPTAFLMGCHLSHFDEVAAETSDLILVNLDDGSVRSSSSDTVDLPDIPPVAADCFTQGCQSLQMHFDLDQCCRGSGTDINEQRDQRRAWQRRLNDDIQRLALELIVNLFRDVIYHLNYEHRVFHSEEFLKTRQPTEKPFYKKVLETQIFHSFLKDRLNKKADPFTRMELHTRSETQKKKMTLEIPRRPTMQEIQARRASSVTENRLSRRLGTSLPNLQEDLTIGCRKNSILTRTGMSDTAPKSAAKLVKVFGLPDFPASLSLHSVQSYYGELLHQLGKAITSVQNEDSALLARFYYLRGFINMLCSRRLDALSDFQNLYKTDTAILPAQLVPWLVASLHRDEQQQAQKRPDLRRLLVKVKMDNEKPLIQTNDHVRKFELPRHHLHEDAFVRCVQECGIVKDVATMRRLFEALTDGQIKQVDPELFRVFYTFWKEMEAEARDVHLPSEVIEHLDSSECVYKVSARVKTSHGVGKLAMTQKRLFLLTDGPPSFLEITKFRDIQEVKVTSAPFLIRIPSLRIHTCSRPEVFEANLKTETELWNLVIKEMWAGRKIADQHKDPQYMTQALTNVLLMDAVMGCLQTQRSISAAAKLAYFDQLKHEVPMMVPRITAETLKHKINPSVDLAEPQTVHVLLYTPGQLTCKDSQWEMNPKLWVALSGGRIVVFDAASWSLLQDCIQVGESQVTCMMGVVHNQVWIGSQDSVIYIFDTNTMTCNKQLTEHRSEVTALSVDTKHEHNSQYAYSCSSDGTILQWNSSGLTVKRQFLLTCDRLSSVQVHDGVLWCCCTGCIVELKKSGTPQRRIALPEDLQSMSNSFSCFIVIPERGQLWTGCADSADLFLWHINNHKHPFKRISLPGISGITCMIQVKNQIWVGCRGRHGVGGQCDGQLRSQVLVVDLDSFTVTKELQAHSDSIQTLCSAEDRYVLSGSARQDGRIAIWRVE
ncbi:DENN domain-containing protein 3 [Oryzias melastigma]|uniref:DENN domain containing 3 n=1 Tax=Oryzias melastigma TaxID=30732 RepID=A0A3B3BCT7_ORYME|nr:DENN domain-containing protein 3 [Oryzias melastigma]